MDGDALYDAAIAGDADAVAALEMQADKLHEYDKFDPLHDCKYCLRDATILHVESTKGNTERVRFILKKLAHKKLLVKLDEHRKTALVWAAYFGHTQVAKLLIDEARHILPPSANDNTHDNPFPSFHAFLRHADLWLNTALHLAAEKGRASIVKLLVEADPTDTHIQNKVGKTPMYLAVEEGHNDIVEIISTTCTAPSLDGPGGTTALHEAMENGNEDAIRMIINAAKRWGTPPDAPHVSFEALFNQIDESGRTVLELAVMGNHVNMVDLILKHDPAYQDGRGRKKNGLMRLIYKAIDNKYSHDIIKLLSEAYEAGINPDHKGVLDLILSMKMRDEDSVLRLLGDAKHLVTFTEDNGWTPLHYAVYHEFDSILGAIIEAQEEFGHPFVYENLESTPFYVAVKHGCTSTLLRLMESWPAPSSEVTAANCPYTVVDEISQNILHLAAVNEIWSEYNKKDADNKKAPYTSVNEIRGNTLHLAAINEIWSEHNKKDVHNKKEMVQGILKYCPKNFKDQILKQQDNNGDTPLHLLISHGCFIPELIKHKVLDTMPKNNKHYTPQDMLYFKNDVVADQVRIKIALDNARTNQLAWNFWPKSTKKKTDIGKCIVPAGIRRMKDVKFDEQKKLLMDAKHEQMKKNLERYKMRTNTQIIVTALITTVTFTVGFTMPGGLYQSGDVNQGLVVLSGKKVFNAFMVSDALALILSTFSLFLYFLESLNEDPRQVSVLNASSTVLNILSIMAMMLTFITGTYVVLSHSPVLAITVCVMGSLFFLLIIVLSVKTVYDRKVKRNED